MNGKLSEFFCRLCEGRHTSPRVVSKKLRDFKQKKYSVVRCPKCGFVQLTPDPTTQDIVDFYDNDMQAKALWPNGNQYDILEKKAEGDNLRRRLWLEEYVPYVAQAKILDFGCGYGFFVHELCQQGYDAMGVDASINRIRLAKLHKKGKFLRHSVDESFETSYQNFFDAITAFHVLEHVNQPSKMVADLLSMVKPGGFLFFEVPNIDDEMITQIKEYADHQWQFGHLSYFDKKSLEVVASQGGASEFFIKGVQRYGLDHLFKWRSDKKPNLKAPDYSETIPLFEHIERKYRDDREGRMTCDTLTLTIQR